MRLSMTRPHATIAARYESLRIGDMQESAQVRSGQDLIRVARRSRASLTAARADSGKRTATRVRRLLDHSVFDPAVLKSAEFRVVRRTRLRVAIPLRGQDVRRHAVADQRVLDGIGAAQGQRQIAGRIARVVRVPANLDSRTEGHSLDG